MIGAYNFYNDYIRKDLQYKYTRLLLKDFTYPENHYLSFLRSNIDDFIDEANKWTSANTDELKGLHDEGDWEEYYSEMLEMLLITMMNTMLTNNHQHIRNFYIGGNNLAHNHMDTPNELYSSDEIALQKLYNYTDTVMDSINTEFIKGIKQTIGKNITNKTYDNIQWDIIQLPYTKIQSPFTIDTRCVFATKTEYGRSVNTGLLQGYSNYGVDTYDIITTGLPNVCKTCEGYEENNPYTLNEIINMLPVHPNCYMPDTQVFTDNGWKYFYELEQYDKILSLNPSDYTTEFIDFNKIIKTKNIYGYMYHIYNRWFDICVTPNHDCFVLQRKMENFNRGLTPEFRKPSELTSESYFLRKIENNNVSNEHININGLKFKTRDYVFFMAWYLSEGNVLHNLNDAKRRKFPIYISQSIEDNYKLLKEELKKICGYLNIRLYCGKTQFELHSKELFDYLYTLGYYHEKYVPNELFRLSKEDLVYFLENYIKGDGHVKDSSNNMVSNSITKYIFTSSNRLMNDLSYLILLAGFYPSIKVHSKKGTVVKHHNGEYVQNHDIYRISINNSKTACFSNCKIDKIEYSGEVYCVELPKYHTLWTLRNGKTSWNGNCSCSVKARLPKTLYLQDKAVIVDLTPKSKE